MYISAYYHIPKRSMRHMGISRYLRLAPETLRMIAGSRLIFYYEEDCIGEVVGKMCAERGIELHLVQVPLTELPQRQPALEIAEAASRENLPDRNTAHKEKGWSHLTSLVHGDDRSEYRDNLTVWLSKLELVEQAQQFMTENEKVLAWMDFGISKVNYLRENWNFPSLTPAESKISHYRSTMRLLGRELPLNASLMISDSETWKCLVALFQSELQKRIGDGYPHDEETILSTVVRSRPDLFHCLGGAYTGPLKRLRYLTERWRAGALT